MAQIRTWDFGHDDDTLTLNEALHHQMVAGVYGGFEVTVGSSAGLNLALRHDPHPSRAALVARTDGVTSVPATRQLTTAAGLNALIAVGDLLRIEDFSSTGDDGDYIVVAHTDTTITVDRDWPAGSLTNLRFRVYSALGTIRTPAGVVVRENACQDNLMTVTAGGAQTRVDRVVCRYVYNASAPPNTASYLVLAGTIATASVADGDVTSGARTFTSATGGFLALSEGHRLRVADATDDANNGDYEIVRIVNDTTLIVDRSWADETLTGLDFQVLKPPALTANDVLLAEVEMPAGAPSLATAIITQAGAQSTNAAASSALSQVIEPGVYRGVTIRDGSTNTRLTVDAGLVVTPYGTTLDIELDQTDALTLPLAAAGFHRMSAIVLKRREGPGFDPSVWSIHEVQGTAVATSAAPRLPNMATILAGVGSADPRDVTVIGAAYVSETLRRGYSVGKKQPPRAITVHGGNPDHSGTQGDLFGPDGIREAIDAYWALLSGDTFAVQPETTRTSERAFEVLLRGTFDMYGPLVCPSRVKLVADQGRATIQSQAAVALKWAGREFVGDDLVPTWGAVAQVNPSDTPAGYDLFRLTIDAAYQTGDDFNDLLISRWDPVQLREGADAASSHAGWVHQVVGAWVIDVFLPSAFDVNADEGDLRIAKRLCGARGVTVQSLDSGVAATQFLHVDDGELTHCRHTQLTLAYLRDSEVTGTVDTALTQVVTASAMHSEARQPNRYALAVLDGSCTLGGSSPQGSIYRLDLRASTAQAWTLGEDGALYEFIRLDGRDPACTLAISGTGAMALDIRAQATDQTTVSATDRALNERAAYLNADRNMRISTAAGTAFSWDGSTLTYPAVTIEYAGETFSNVLAAGSQALADGEACYVTLDRKAAAPALALSVAALTAVPQSDLTLVIAYRKGTTLFFWDGSRMASGEAGSPGVVSVGDGSVTFDKLDPTAIQIAVAGLGNFTDKPRANLVDPNEVVFDNAGAATVAYDNATGWGSYSATVDLSSVRVGDIMLVNGYRWRVYEVDDAGDRLRLQSGLSGIWGLITPAVDPFDYVVVRGNVHWRNAALDAYSYDLIEAAGTDGDTSTGNSTFVSAAAAFLTTAREGGLLVLKENGANDNDNGYYRIASVTNNTTLEIEGEWTDGTMTGVDYEVRAGEVTIVDQGVSVMPPGGREPHFVATDGTRYIIRNSPSNTKLVIDPVLDMDTSAPSEATHGSVELANNPRGLLFDDCSVRFGVESIRLNGDLLDLMEEQKLGWATGMPTPAQGFRHEPRVRFYGGGWQFDERGARLHQDDFLGQEVHITFFGTYALPRFTTGVGDLSQILDGVLLQGAGVTGDFSNGMDMPYEPHASAWAVNSQDLVHDIIPALGIHTLILRLPAAFDTAVAGVTGDEFVLEGFDIIVHPSNDEVVEVPGTAFVEGRPAALTQRSTVALPTPTGTKGARIVRYVAPDGTRAWATHEGRSIADVTADAVATDTLSNVSADPELTGLRPGDLVLLIGAGSEEIRVVESTPTADTIVLTAATTLNEVGITVRYRGRTADEGTNYLSAVADMHDYEDVVTMVPIVAMGSGSEVVSSVQDGAAAGGTGAAILYTAEDGVTTIRIQSGSYDLITTDRRGVSAGGGSEIWFTFVGTGLDAWVAFSQDTDAGWNLNVDGVACGVLPNLHSRGTNFGKGPAQLVPLVADLPFGTHTVKLDSAWGGSIRIEGMVVYAQKEPTYSGLGLAEGFIPADTAEARQASIEDPGDGWIRCVAGRRVWYRAAGSFAATIDDTVRGHIKIGTSDNNELAYHRFWGEDAIWWGVLGASDTFEWDGNGVASGDVESMSLGLHLGTLDSGSADLMEWHAVDVKVPVYAYHTRDSYRDADWLGYGGGLRDIRRVHPDLRLPQLVGRRRIAAMYTSILAGDYAVLHGCTACLEVKERGLYEIHGYGEESSTDAAAIIKGKLTHNGAWLGMHVRERVNGVGDIVSVQVRELAYLDPGWHWFALMTHSSAGNISSEQRGLTVRRLTP